jgi:hypothetical protein
METWLCPRAIVPVEVPPRTPVPVARASDSPVAALTAEALPNGSCDSTTTAKAAAAVGLEPPLTDVTASFVGAADATVNASPAPFEWLPSLTVRDADSAL